MSLDQSFASIASNCVIDQYGRVGARKGYTHLSTDSSTATQYWTIAVVLKKCMNMLSDDGTKVVFSAGKNQIFTGTTTLAPVTLPNAYTITANDWKIVTFNNDVVFLSDAVITPLT